MGSGDDGWPQGEQFKGLEELDIVVVFCKCRLLGIYGFVTG